jgi:hypothetical protein
MNWQGSPPDHWTARLGIIAMQFAAGASFLAGCVGRYGDSLQEQAPAFLPSQGLPFSDLPPTNLYSGPNCSQTFNCGLMGIGAADLYQAIQQLCGTTQPGRAIFSVGTNDASPRNHTASFLEAWQTDVANAIGLLINKVGDAQHVLIETIPYALDGAHDNDLIDQFNNCLAALAGQRGALLYDLRARLFDGRTPRQTGALAGDNVHLGGWGIYRRAFDEQCAFTGQALPALS